MTKVLRSILLLGFFAALLAGCGGGGGGGDEQPPPETPAPGPGPTPLADVTLAQLAGTWFGSFDGGAGVQTIEITVDASGNITALKLGGNPTTITGTVTKAAARTFNFTLKDPTDPDLNSGSFLVEGTPNPPVHMVYIDRNTFVGALQKDATSLGGFAQADIEKAWSGETNKAAATNQDASSATCTSSTATTSSCTGTIGSVSRSISSLTLDDSSGGRWVGSYTDSASGSVRAYLSSDKAFAAVLACTNAAPPTCDYSAWRRP